MIRADVCIVGAGPAGITLAESWRDAGFHTVIVDGGGCGANGSMAPVSSAENADPLYYRIDQTRAHGFGGSANWWKPIRGVRVRPLDRLDLALGKNSTDRVAQVERSRVGTSPRQSPEIAPLHAHESKRLIIPVRELGIQALSKMWEGSTQAPRPSTRCGQWTARTSLACLPCARRFSAGKAC